MAATNVRVLLGDKEVATVVVAHDDHAEPIQLAASAHAGLSNDAIYVVDGQQFTADEIKEWWA